MGPHLILILLGKQWTLWECVFPKYTLVEAWLSPLQHSAPQQVVLLESKNTSITTLSFVY